ncbi:hypothetical protein TWF192_009510 [Orbilia oligospora]|uniref:Uncharacterized protein n=1 Tax=Orbilia oligospora TaxID=2813651 RepID=A0A6G1M017_ORBOL|nr:hypothetical protein TWF191_009306 [Orbilia oligospora]KAF3240417.1 hypothetical protein TWF192_009510 [Orbilia oligospora]
MKPTIISTAALCLLLSTLPSFVLGRFEMAFDNYLYGEGRAPQYRAYDDQSCNRIPPITSDPRVVMSIAMRSTPEGIDIGYNTRPPPAIAFYFDPNPAAPGPQHCLDSQLVMVARYYGMPESQEFFFSPLGEITHFKVVDEGSYPWRMWDENVGYENGDIGRIGTVIWATGEGWRRRRGTDVMIRDVGYDWQPVIRAGQDWITSEDPDSGSSGEGEGNVARVGDILDDDDDGESSNSDTLMLRRLPPRQPYNPAVQEEEEQEDSPGFSPPRGLRASRQRANDGENLGYSPLINPSMEDHDGYAGSVDFEFPEEEEEAFRDYTDPDEMARQEMYHTRRIFQLADLQRQQQRMAMMEPVTFNGRLMQGRNDAIVAGNYTAIPESQRHRSYGDLVSNGWYIDPEQELRARWQEYMRIAFLRFKEQHGIAAGVTVEQLTERERGLFVDFLRRDGTPMFFQDSYMRPIINSHAQQQLINSFGLPPALPDQQAANLRPNPFLRIEEDLEDAIRDGGRRVAAQRERERAAQDRYNRRIEQLRRQNEIANNRARQITMVRDPNWANQRRRQRQRRRRPLRQDDLGFVIDSDAEGFENYAGARSRIMRNQPGARRVNRNLEQEINAWDDLIVEADDEYEAGWNIPDLEPPAPVPQPLVDGGGWEGFQPPAFNFGGVIPPELLRRPPSPSTEPGDNPRNMAEEEGEEVIDPDAPLPRFQRFNSAASSSPE